MRATLDTLPPRRPGLGHYNATRAEWAADYRAARIDKREGRAPDPKHSGTRWKAALVLGERETPDPLSVSLAARAEAARIVSAILSERSNPQT